MPISYKKNRAMSRILRNKFHAAPAQHIQATPEPAAAEPLDAEIPKSYNDTYVRAIPKDPQSTFVYWEMPQKDAASNGMEANGRIHAENGEAEAIQNKVSGGIRRGGFDNNNNGGNNQDNHQNNNHGQNQAQYYDFESSSWRSGDNIQQQWDNNRNNIPQRYENSMDNNQSYHNDSNDSGQNALQHNHDYGGRQDNAQTYQHQPDDNGCGRNWRHRRHGHDNDNQQYYHILTQFIPPGNTGCVYLETSGIIANATVVLDICKCQVRHDIAEYSTLLDICKSQVRLDTAEYSILLDICKSQVNSDSAVFANLSSGALYKKTDAAPPPHLSSGILYNSNTGAAGRA